MNRIVIALAAASALASPLASQACTATGYIITVAVPEAFPNTPATVWVRHPVSTGPVSAATTTSFAVVSAATAAVSGNQRVQMIATGGGTGTCPGAPVGTVTELALRP